MYLNLNQEQVNAILDELISKSISELEEELLKTKFNDRESAALKKGKELLDEGSKFGPNDSASKVFRALMIYYLIKCQEQNSTQK